MAWFGLVLKLIKRTLNSREMSHHDIERSILELTLRKSDLQKEIDEIDLQIAFLCEQKKEAQEDS